MRLLYIIIYQFFVFNIFFIILRLINNHFFIKITDMGKGDKRTKRGKIIAGSYGKSRLRKKKLKKKKAAAAAAKIKADEQLTTDNV